MISNLIALTVGFYIGYKFLSLKEKMLEIKQKIKSILKF